MTRIKIYRIIALITFLLILLTEFVIAQNKITAGVISSGGEKSANTNYNLNSTVGESFIGKTSGTEKQNNLGFWYVYKQSTVTEVEKEDEAIPNVFKLDQNYPNPFNPSTIIKFGIPERSNVMLKIYDILGAEILTLVNEELEAGWYSKKFNATNYSSGIYIFRMQASQSGGQVGTYVNTKKMMLLK